ncbi:hypothetical protein B0H16DRAFT_1734191 [Mycena metata]|uniref:Uncharacterized protein n=1 Tax=Mycena metata TaxID=1033252 RepID=A0AAD7HXD3_9AGAR|nr:hypothetical protein B0H16DRAFT_1734191 [Mycena metata]
MLAILPLLVPVSVVTPDAGCVSACTTFAKDGQLFAGSVSALCSSTLVDASAQCFGCMVGADLITQTVAQNSIDDYIHICALLGFAINSVTITASSTGSTAPAGCVSACTAVAQDDQAAAGSTTALCTPTFDNTYTMCFDCMVGADLITQGLAQSVMDGHVQRCAVNGFTLSSVTITGSPAASGGTTVAATAAASPPNGSTGSNGTSSTGSNGSSSPNGFRSSAKIRLRVNIRHLAVSVVAVSILSALVPGSS